LRTFDRGEPAGSLALVELLFDIEHELGVSLPSGRSGRGRSQMRPIGGLIAGVKAYKDMEPNI